MSDRNYVFHSVKTYSIAIIEQEKNVLYMHTSAYPFEGSNSLHKYQKPENNEIIYLTFSTITRV